MRQDIFEKDIRQKDVDDIVSTTPHQRWIMADNEGRFVDAVGLVPFVCHHLEKNQAEEKQKRGRMKGR